MFHMYTFGCTSLVTRPVLRVVERTWREPGNVFVTVRSLYLPVVDTGMSHAHDESSQRSPAAFLFSYTEFLSEICLILLQSMHTQSGMISSNPQESGWAFYLF